MIPSEALYNPAVPFVDHLGLLHAGATITIQGYVLPTAREFQVNLACGNIIDGPARSDIAMHFNPRLHQKYVARNSFQMQQWGTEEGEEPAFPFQNGQNFEIMILVDPTHYKIAVNGLHFITYDHRTPIERVNTLQIVGDVEILMLLLRDPMSGPPGVGGMPPTGIPQGIGMPPTMPPSGGPPAGAIYNPAVPFEQMIPGGMYPGKTVFISGRPTPYANRFNIDLVCVQHFKGPDTIAFHFNPRFQLDGNVVVRNAHIDGYWGEEERHIPQFPFMKDTSFDIRILCEADKFLVYVGGQHFCSYNHRLPYNFIEKVAVQGDVVIASLSFQG